MGILTGKRRPEKTAGRPTGMKQTEKAQIDPESRSFKVENWPFFVIVQLASRYHLRLDEVLKPIGMDVARWRTLMIVASRESATVTEIADVAVSRISTMAKIIQRMTAQDLVATRPSPEDARATEVTITANGRAVLSQIKTKVARLSDRAFQGVSERDLETLNRIAGRIHENLLP